MAKIGLSNIWYATCTDAGNGTVTYGTATAFGRAVSVNVSVDNADARLYADNILAEIDNQFIGGTVSLTVADQDEEVFAALLGHTVANNEVTKADTDVAPYVGIGYVVTYMQDGTLGYRGYILSKAKFSEPSVEANTRGQATEFGTTTIEGAIMKTSAGKWCKVKDFAALTDAVSYVKAFA